MKLLLFQIFVHKILCGIIYYHNSIVWEVYKHELYDISSSSNWISQNTGSTLNTLTLIDSTICTPASSTFLAGGADYIWRQIDLPSTRTFSKIRIQLDIYYIDFWQDTRIIVYLNNVVISDTEFSSSTTTLNNVQYCSLTSITRSGDDYIQNINYEIPFSSNKLSIEITKIGLPITRIYAISNFYLHILFCEDYCEQCDENGQCMKCYDGYTLTLQGCQCQLMNGQYKIDKQYQFFNPTLTCVTSCPTGYVPDYNQICQPGTSTLFFNDLDNTIFTSYLLTLENDKYYTTDFSQYRITQIDGYSVAGPFGFNEKLIYQPLSLIPNSKVLLKFRLYYFNKMGKIGNNLKIRFNGYEMVQITDFDYAYPLYQNGKYISYNQQKCNITSTIYCEFQDFQFIFNIDFEITQIIFDGKFTITYPFRSWGIRDFSLTSLTYSGNVISCSSPCLSCQNSLWNCTSCQSGYYLFNNKCLTICPLQTTLTSGTCVEDGISTTTFRYLFNTLYDDNNYQDLLLQQTKDILFTSLINVQNYQIYGGLNQQFNSEIIHQFTYPIPIYKIYLKLNVLAIDYQQDEKFQIKIVVSTTYTQTYLVTLTPSTAQDYQFNSLGNIIGQSYTDYSANVFITYSGFNSINSFNITFMRSSALYSYQYYGLYDYRVLVEPCPNLCDQCDQTGNCIGTQLSCNSGKYYDTNSESCIDCSLYCDICTDQYTCTSCNSQYLLFNGFCYYSSTVKDKFSHVSVTNCEPGCSICETTQVDYQSHLYPYQSCLQCDEDLYMWLDVERCSCLSGYYFDYYTCLPCSAYCKSCKNQPRVCTDCDSTLNRELHYQACECKTGYYDEDDNIACSQCDSSCYTCRFYSTYCTSCYPTQFRTILNRVCICQDGYYDSGVAICSKCNDKCQTCINLSICTSCYSSQHRKLTTISNSCICMAGYFEVEDSLICASCHYSCSACQLSSLSTMCTRCPSSREPSIDDTVFSCVCRKGYYESYMTQCSDCRNYTNPPITHYCYSNCGDSIVQWNEECDDGNSNAKDGCYNCLLATSYCLNSLCTKCENSLCTKCIDGYYVTINNVCEQCDQSCLTCITRYDNCTTCALYESDGITCKMCQTDKGYQIQNNQCVTICGDGLKVGSEECDDGNNENGDGCYNCLVESGWVCQNQCELIIYPQILFEEDQFDYSYDGTRNVKVYTSIQLSMNGTINDLCNFSIQNIDQYEITQLQDISDYTNTYNILQLQVTIELQSRSLNPLLICTIGNSSSFLSEQGFTFDETSFNFTLLQYEKQDEGVVAATEGLMSLSKYILYLLLGLAIFAFLVGGLDIFWNLLDVLQLISYLQFLNVVYPYNVDQYFQLFDFAQFDFIKEVVDIEQYINDAVVSPQPDYKFANQGYSTTFFINGVAVFTVFITTLCTYLACRFGFVILAKILQFYTDDEDTSLEEEPNIIKFILFRISRNIGKILMKTVGEFNSGFIRTFMAVAYDYNIAIFLQMKDATTQNSILFASFLTSILFLIIEFFFFYKGFAFMSNKTYYYKQFMVEKQYGSLYEGINIRNSNPYSNYYNMVLLMKKVTFVFFLVNLYSAPPLQIISCSFLNLIFTIYICYNKPIEEAYEHWKTIGSEILIWLAELFIILLYYYQQYGFDEDQQLFIGWFIIAACTLLILYQFVLDVKQHFEYLGKEFKVISRLLRRIKGIFIKQDQIEEAEDLMQKDASSPKLKNKVSTKSTLKQRKLVTFKINK